MQIKLSKFVHISKKSSFSVGKSVSPKNCNFWKSKLQSFTPTFKKTLKLLYWWL